MRIKNVLPGKLGFGTAPLGNMFRNISDEEAAATVQAAWDQGIRYYDTAPFHGAGLAEIRLGEVLSQHPRNAYVLSTKVGRVILDEVENAASRDLGEKGGLFEHGRPNKMVNDYTEEGTLRSVEDSLKRLKADYLDIVWVHDVPRTSTVTSGSTSSTPPARAPSGRCSGCGRKASSRPGAWASTASSPAR